MERRSHAAGRSARWILAGALVGAVGLAAVGALLALELRRRVPETVEPVEPVEAPEVRVAGEVEAPAAAGIEIGPVEVAAAPEAPVEVAATPPVEAAEPEARVEPPRPRRAARRPVEATEPAPTPPAMPPDDPAARAIALSARGDREGCIRETRRHPRSIRLLTTRLGCAAGNTAETIATCREIRQHYPSSPWSRSCESILRAHGAL